MVMASRRYGGPNIDVARTLAKARLEAGIAIDVCSRPIAIGNGANGRRRSANLSDIRLQDS